MLDPRGDQDTQLVLTRTTQLALVVTMILLGTVRYCTEPELTTLDPTANVPTNVPAAKLMRLADPHTLTSYTPRTPQTPH